MMDGTEELNLVFNFWNFKHNILFTHSLIVELYELIVEYKIQIKFQNLRNKLLNIFEEVAEKD